MHGPGLDEDLPGAIGQPTALTEQDCPAEAGRLAFMFEPDGNATGEVATRGAQEA